MSKFNSCALPTASLIYHIKKALFESIVLYKMFRKCFSHTLVILTSVLMIMAYSQVVNATEKGFAVDYLRGEGDVSGLRLAYRPHYGRFTDFKWIGDVDLYWEVSVNFWEFGANNQHATNYALAISPVISSQFATVFDKYPIKWEFGIGVSLVQDTQFAGKDIGSHYQFEDRLGLIMEFGEELKQSLAIRYMHYSNGGLNTKNPGLDFLNLSYAKRF
jgi:hypothetical protein